MNLLVTGGAGFIGSSYVRLVRRARPGDRVVNVDALTYAGNLENLRDLENDPGHVFVRADIRDGAAMLRADAQARRRGGRELRRREPRRSQHHVGGAVPGHQRRRDAAAARGGARAPASAASCRCRPTRSTEPRARRARSTETTPIAPRSPYSASKAAADHLVAAFHHTHGMDAVITRCSNNYGPYQFPEKLIPLMIMNALAGEPLPVYGDGLNVRDWIHVEDHCEAVDAVLLARAAGRGLQHRRRNERTNMDVVRAILPADRTRRSLIRHVTDRPGHDRRYAMDARKIRDALGWRPRHDVRRRPGRDRRLVPARTARGRSASAAAPTATTTSASTRPVDRGRRRMRRR